ncbi:MAG: YitT family protein [Clostridia bacterium]|nr:YitT family protein [Clostridia bacterium]
MKPKEIIKRYALFIISLFFSGLGVAMTKHGALGVSPISSVANVLSLRFTFLSIGSWLIVTNCLMVLAQILILRKKFRPIQLLQIPLSFLFGYFTDLGMLLISPIPAEAYPVRLALVVGGVAVLGFGISLSVIANVIMNAGEGLVKAVADTAGKPFGTVKVIFDVSYVTFSILLSLLLFSGSLRGTREGTVIAAVGTGFVVKLFNRLLAKPLDAALRK